MPGERWSVELHPGESTVVAALSVDRVWAAYALGDLEPPFDAYSSVAVASSGAGEAACLTLRHPQFTVIISAGEPAGVAAILNAAELPETVLLSIRLENRAAFAEHYRFPEGLTRMRRMVLSPAATVGVPGGERLKVDDGEALLRLYGEYPGSAFHPDHLTGGCFFGIRQRGELVAAAGTHIASSRFDLAAVGNVFTRGSFRGRGFGEALTRSVVQALREEGIGLIVLNVAVENVGAARIYERIGFRDHCEFLEGTAVRR
jgi:GNAT superfamily N-acetyltransferase